MAREPFAARHTSKWVGALFFWVLKRFQGKYSDQLIEKFDSRNFWTGYFLSLLAFCFIFYLIFF
jgi:hypothetical protein